jgi:hypothetical protein
MNATDKYTYALFPSHSTIANRNPTGTIFCTYRSLVMFTPLTTFRTRTITNANTEQNAMCIMVSVTGNGNPKLVKTYLLYRMTPAESEIQSPTYEYVAIASSRRPIVARVSVCRSESASPAA